VLDIYSEDRLPTPLEFFASGAEGLFIYHPGSNPVLSTFAWVGYSISRDRHEEAVNIISCTLYHPPNGALGLTALDDDTVDWLQTTELCIWWNNRSKRRRPTPL